MIGDVTGAWLAPAINPSTDHTPPTSTQPTPPIDRPNRTQTLQQQAGVINKLRECLDEFNALYVFSFEHMRSAKFKDVRIDWRDSRCVPSR